VSECVETRPSGLTNVIAIAAGAYHNMACKADGTIVTWGLTRLVRAQCRAACAISPPSQRDNNTSIAAGGRHSLALVGQPSLRAQISGSDFILSWPTWAQNFTLLTTTNLADQHSWTLLTNVPAVVNQQVMVTNQATGGQRFYRLIE
jgi:alpha-tubulin suppressor-like RCC1 family protein